MEHQPPNVFVAPDPEPFPPSPRTVDLTPLEFILALLALVTIPALIYALIFSLRCPTSNPFNRTTTTTSDIHQTPTPNKKEEEEEEEEEQVLGLKYKKETHSTDIGSECPVCLSVFVDGEEVKKLGACTHSFHAECIDLWLRSHSSCPLCRASVKRSSDRRRRPSGGDGDEDFRQGLPDASTLV